MKTDKISHAAIRMYKLGTGDCLLIKFLSGKNDQFNMMIDAGCWTGEKQRLTPFIKNLKEYTNNNIDLLVITHEHKDHVHAFDVCEELFTENFNVTEIWMGWTENDQDQKVKEWKEAFGEKKKALYEATRKYKSLTEDIATRQQLGLEKYGEEIFSMRENFLNGLMEFSALHFDNEVQEYKGSLKGMGVIKEKIAKNNIQYRSPGEIIEKPDKLPGIKIYILGPPLAWEEIKKESGKKEEGYDHNKNLPINEAFVDAALTLNGSRKDSILPFDSKYKSTKPESSYDAPENLWRNINDDWLNSAGMLALRINSRTNNLSLALAIEFVDSGKIMLFPGDAEIGSWESWHKINWEKNNGKSVTTEEILGRTVFYKVAHHLSHNGTAKKLGLDMMNHKELVSMATVDYDNISPRWITTIPNKAVLEDLLRTTKGRLMMMNEKGIYYDRKYNILLTEVIQNYQNLMSEGEIENFKSNITETDLFFEFRLMG